MIPFDSEVHAWGDWKVTTPATQTEEGIETRVCEDCGDVEIRMIPETGTSGGSTDSQGSTDSHTNIQNAEVILSSPAFAYNGEVLKP